MSTDSDLVKKYNIPCPRYTSYPTVPYWNAIPPTQEQWVNALRDTYSVNREQGISIYIHLPFCESLCTFCGCNKRITKNHNVEKGYIEAVLKEWNLYKSVLGGSLKIKEIHLGGGTPTFFSPENLAYLIYEIFKDSDRDAFSEFGFEAHPHSTTKAHLQTLYACGFTRLSLGVQDTDPEVQKIIHRIQNIKEIESVTENARKIGYTSINFDLIYGLPKQTQATMDSTLRTVKKLKPDRIALYSFAFIPWLKPGQRKFTEYDLPTDEKKRNLYEFSKRELAKMGYVEIGMDHFSLRTDSLYKALVNKTLHRNFMGYTSAYSAISIGLGCSAISDSWNAFIQNEKTVETYVNIIQSENRLPVIKGHLLTEEDQQIRKHILNLMCQFTTKIEETELNFLDEIYPRLSEMETDALLKYENTVLAVTEKGKPFVRNICRAFDRKFWKKIPSTQTFSTVI